MNEHLVRNGLSTNQMLSSNAADLRRIAEAIRLNLTGSTSRIRSLVEECTSKRSDDVPPAMNHLSTALEMCEDAKAITRRCVEFLDQLASLETPKPQPVRLDKLLYEVDRELLPIALSKGVIWSCGSKQVSQCAQLDYRIALEALLDFACMAIESANSGDVVSLTVQDDSLLEFRLCSNASELIKDLALIVVDPLFNQTHALAETCSDFGSRFAFALERLFLINGTLFYDRNSEGQIKAIRIQFSPTETNSAE